MFHVENRITGVQAALLGWCTIKPVTLALSQAIDSLLFSFCEVR